MARLKIEEQKPIEAEAVEVVEEPTPPPVEAEASEAAPRPRRGRPAGVKNGSGKKDRKPRDPAFAKKLIDISALIALKYDAPEKALTEMEGELFADAFESVTASYDFLPSKMSGRGISVLYLTAVIVIIIVLRLPKGFFNGLFKRKVPNNVVPFNNSTG